MSATLGHIDDPAASHTSASPVLTMSAAWTPPDKCVVAQLVPLLGCKAGWQLHAAWQHLPLLCTAVQSGPLPLQPVCWTFPPEARLTVSGGACTDRDLPLGCLQSGMHVCRMGCACYALLQCCDHLHLMSELTCSCVLNLVSSASWLRVCAARASSA